MEMKAKQARAAQAVWATVPLADRIVACDRMIAVRLVESVDP